MINKSEPHIIFIHRGRADYLEFSLKQALRFNPRERIHLIGDAAVAGYGSLVQFRPIESCMAGADEFAKVYEHHCTNPYDFELFCFQRWFVLRDFMRQERIEKCFYADSDIMIYFDAAKEYSRFSNYDLMLSCGIDGHGSWWKSLEILEKFCGFAYDIYAKKDAKNYTRMINHLARLQRLGHWGGVCDMTVLGLFKNLEPKRVAEATEINGGATYDDNLNVSLNGSADRYKTRGGIKKIIWREGIPFGRLINTNQAVQFKTIHCQSTAKELMGTLYGYRQPNYLLYSLKFWTNKIFNRLKRINKSPKKNDIKNNFPNLTSGLRAKLHPWRNSEIKRKIFFDCGSNKGRGFEWFRRLYGMDGSWLIYLFEPTPELYKKLNSSYAKEANIHCRNSAVWTNSGRLNFFLSFDDGGSLIFKNIAQFTGATLRKRQAGKRGEINGLSADLKLYSSGDIQSCSVPSINFSELIKQTARPDDYIVIKMDIEGAEYPVLRQMLKDGAFKLIDEIYIEFHDRFIPAESPKSNRELIKEIEQQGAIVYDWD